jgi:hypothetical protein
MAWYLVKHGQIYHTTALPDDFYSCDIWSLILKIEHKLQTKGIVL